MNQVDDFRGLCPLCYKPVKQEDDYRVLVYEEDRYGEVYHMDCLTEYVKAESTEDADTKGIGMSILEQQKHLFVSKNEVRREQWKATMAKCWATIGRRLKESREELHITRNHIAKQLGISPGRLKKFEGGEAVQDAKLIEKAYEMCLKLCVTETKVEEPGYIKP